MLKTTNNASTTLASSLASAGTTITLTGGGGSLFPTLGAGDYFYATLCDSSNNLEVVKVTARSADTLTVVRAQDGTVARNYAAGDKLELRLVAAVFNELIQRDGSVAFTGAVSLGGNRISSVADPTAAQDAATKNYVDTTAVAAVNAEAATRASADTAEANARAAADAQKADKTGGNATGTWPISVSGSATSVPWTGVTGRPTALSGFTNDLTGVFAQRSTVLSAQGADRDTGYRTNCGNINCNARTSTGMEVYDSGDGRHQLRVFYGITYSYNCNCNCCCCC